MSDKQQSSAGPVTIAGGDAKRRLQQKGELIIYRPSKRTPGETWWRDTPQGEKVGDCQFELVTPIDAGDRDALREYFIKSGYNSARDWQEAIRDVFDGVVDGYLYRLTSDDRCAECESCHEYSPAVEQVGGREPVWRCPDCRGERDG